MSQGVLACGGRDLRRAYLDDEEPPVDLRAPFVEHLKTSKPGLQEMHDRLVRRKAKLVGRALFKDRRKSTPLIHCLYCRERGVYRCFSPEGYLAHKSQEHRGCELREQERTGSNGAKTIFCDYCLEGGTFEGNHIPLGEWRSHLAKFHPEKVPNSRKRLREEAAARAEEQARWARRSSRG